MLYVINVDILYKILINRTFVEHLEEISTKKIKKM